MKELFWRGIHLSYATCIKPLSKHDEEKRPELIFTIALWIMLIAMILISALSPFTILLAGILTLSRKGLVRLASYLFIGIYFFAITYCIYELGAKLSLAILHYAAAILLSNALIGSRFGMATAGAAVAMLMTANVLEFDNILNNSFGYFSAITVSWLSNREKNRAVERRAAELYRFVEFGRLSAGIFHDLVNPLTSISLIVEKLKEEVPESRSVEYVENAIAASKRMGSFLNIARKHLGSDAEKSIFSAEKEMCEAVRLLEYKARSLYVEIGISIAENIEIYGSPVRFFQIMENLISNAVDSYKNTDRETTSPRKVIVSMIRTQKVIEISVKDRGCGIPYHLQSSVFKPFFTTKSEHHGIGIGLSTTRQMVKKDFKGTIGMESKPGHGSIFTVRLPVRTKYDDLTG